RTHHAGLRAGLSRFPAWRPLARQAPKPGGLARQARRGGAGFCRDATARLKGREMTTFDPKAAAAFVAEAHRTRSAYRNLPPEIAPRTIADAYAAQEALRELWTPIYGPVRGLKIATTTKVMQELMGIDHPCGGVIYERRIHQSPARL